MASISLVMVDVLATLPVQAFAAGESSLFKPPFEFKRFHVQYNVNSDGTFTELQDAAITVLTEQGVQSSQQMLVATQDMLLMPVPDREIEVLDAYTLKKNGERIAATPADPSPRIVLRSGAPTVSGAFQMQTKFLAFQRVEIGDTLVTSYRASQKKPAFPDNFVVDNVFPESVAYDDASINLSAPASINLRIETFGIDKGRSTTDGKIQKWEWKYKNRPSETLAPNRPPARNRLHISTFKDNNSEMEARRKLMAAAMPPMPERVRCAVLPRNPNDGLAAINMFEADISRLFWSSEDFLRQEVTDWNTPTCVFDDGRPRLSTLRGGFDQAFSAEHDWSKSQARVEFLKKKFPKEPFVAIADARYWVTYAWDARGGGYASSVSDDGWKLFRERLEKAERVLLDTKPHAAELPVWYDLMVQVQSALGRPEDERDKVFLEGVKRYPTYYPTYFTMLNYLLPKWGGTWRTVDNLVKWSVEHTKATEGMSMYARLYWVAGDDSKVTLFKDTFVSWPKMKQGFEDMMARHPKSKWNLNNFAKFACMAGDMQTFLALRKQIGREVMDAAWPENTSLDLCETKFGYSE